MFQRSDLLHFSGSLARIRHLFRKDVQMLHIHVVVLFVNIFNTETNTRQFIQQCDYTIITQYQHLLLINMNYYKLLYYTLITHSRYKVELSVFIRTNTSSTHTTSFILTSCIFTNSILARHVICSLSFSVNE